MAKRRKSQRPRSVQRKTRPFASLYAFSFCGLFLWSGSTLAADATWNNGSSGNWSTGLWSWAPSGSGYPNSSTTNVNILDGTSNVALNTSVSIASLELASNNTLTVLGGRLLSVYGPTIENAGNIQLNGGSGNNADLLLIGDTTLQGSGTITLNTTASGAGDSRIYNNASGAILTNVNNTIQGSGLLGMGQNMALVNQAGGTISANSTGSPLTTELMINNTGGTTNQGLMEARNSGILTFSGNTINNAGGRIEANSGATAQFMGSTVIQGGTLTNNGGTMKTVGIATLDGSTQGALTLNGQYTGTSGSSTKVLGTIINNDNIQMNGGGGNNADLLLAGDTTLQGGGTVTLNTTASGAGDSRIWNSVSGVTLTNVDNTIQGSGLLGMGQNMALVNQAGGTISANSTGSPLATLLTVSATGGTTNQGLMEARNSGILQFSGNTINNAGGRIEANSGATVQFGGGAVIQGGTLTNNGGTMQTGPGHTATLDASTHGALTLNGQYTGTAGSSTSVLGTIINNGNIQMNGGSGNNADLLLIGDTTLQGSGTVTLNTTASGAGDSRIWNSVSGVTLTNFDNTIQGSGLLGMGQNMALVNQEGGTISANSTGSPLTTLLTVSATGGTTNQGLMEARNSGILQFSGNTINNAGGRIEANSGATVQFGGGVAIQGGTLTNTGGTMQTMSGHAATLDGSTHGVLTLNGQYTGTTGSYTYVDGTINNHGNIQMNGGGGNNVNLLLDGNTTLQGGGTVTLYDNPSGIGTVYLYNSANGATLTNVNNTIQGSGELGLGQNMALVNGGVVAANVAGQALNVNLTGGFTNTGTLQATDGGILNITNAFTGTGTARVDGAGHFNVGANSTVGNLINNGTTATALNLGTHNITVSSDYNNANFGEGNSFNRRANVSGSGQILAGGNAVQAITGTNVTNGNTANATLTIGNVRVGSTTYDYQVANTGTTGPSLRGAIQTTANGANLTDARLSGTGVTASNYNTGVPGSNTGDLGVTFTATTAGLLAPLSGQMLNLTSNFDNIAGQKLNIVLASGAAAYNAAVGSATSPVQVANQRIGGSNTAALTVANTATAGSFSEDLNVSIGKVDGAASGSGNIDGRLAGTNNTGAGTITAGVNTTSAGAKTGTITLNYATAGTVHGVSNGLGVASVDTQDVTVNGNVYQAAAGNASSSVQVANQRVGGSNSALLTVANTASGPDGFVEDLNVSIGGVSGATGSGSISGRLAGTDDTGMGAITVGGLDTTSAGAKTGTVTLNYQTAGAVSDISNGLGSASADSQDVTVTGNVYLAAAGAIQTDPLNFGTVQVGQSVFQNLVIRNTAIGESGFVEDLNASFGSTSGTGASLISGTGGLSGILAGTNSTSSNGLMTVSVNTGSAGVVAGNIGVNYYTAGKVDGVSNGLGTAPVGSEDYGVSGTIETVANVINQASPLINNSTIDLGAMRVGDTAPTASVSVTNQATIAPQAALNASISSNAPVTASGSFDLLDPGATNTSSLKVGLNTATAGDFTGANVGKATVAFVSDASNVGNCGTNCKMDIASQEVLVSGKVYQQAVAEVTAVDFGIVHVGENVAEKNVTVKNTASAALNDVLTGSLSAKGPFGISGDLGTTGLAAGNTDSSSIKASLNTTTAGVYTSNSTKFSSHNAEMNDLALGDGGTVLTAQVNNYAAPIFSKTSGSGVLTQNGMAFALDLGDILLNTGEQTVSFKVLNDILFSDSVRGSFALSGNASQTNGFDTFADLSQLGILSVSFDTTTLGTFSEVITLSSTGYNSSGYSGALANRTLTIFGDIVNGGPQPVPEPGTMMLFGVGLSGLAVFGRRRSSARND